jgi:hypothetical protein
MPEVEYEQTDMGMKAVMTRHLPDGREWEVVWEVIWPFTTFLVYVDEPKTERVRVVHFCVPVDDTHQIAANISWSPAGDDQPFELGRRELGPASRRDTSYEYTQRFPDDKEAQEGQGAIAIHGLEHLATSDRGVIMFRKLLRNEIEAVEAGKDPKGILRDPHSAERVRTSAGSVVRALSAPTSG